MTDPTGAMGGDDLTGSPELFATNLLVVRAIEHDMNAVTLRKGDGEITVKNQHDDREYEKETLTEDVTMWTDIKERFQSMTEFGEDQTSGTLSAKTPATERVESIAIAYPDEETIKLTFHYPD